MRIQDFMRRSFSEHKMTATAENPAVYEAANIYLNEKLEFFRQKCKSESSIEICAFCSQKKMYDYYHLCAEYSDVNKELFDKLHVNGVIFKSLTQGRIVFVRSFTKLDANSNKKIVYKLAPVILVEPLTKNDNLALALSLDEISITKNSDDELWEEDDSITNKMTSFFERANSTYESLIEKLKSFKTNDVQIPFILKSLATYKSIKNATLVQIKYSDVQAISTKLFQKNPQLHFDFSFSAIWTQMTDSQTPLRNEKFIQ